MIGSALKWMVVAFLIIPTASLAQEDKRNPYERLMGNTWFEIEKCRLSAELSITLGSVPGACNVDQSKARKDFEAASAFLKKPKAREKLKEYFVFWRGFLAAVPPQSSDSEFTWNRRIAEKSAELERHKAEVEFEEGW